MAKIEAISWVVGKEYQRIDGQIVRCLATDCHQAGGTSPVVLMNIATGELTVIDVTGGRKIADGAPLPWVIAGEAA